MRPHGSIVVEQSCGGDKRHHLEEGATEGPFQSVAVTRHQQIANPYGGTDDDGNVKLKLGTLEQGTWPEFENGYVEHHEVDASQELEQDGNVLDGGRLEELGRIVMCRETTSSSCSHGVVDAVKPVHASKIEREDAA